MSIEFEIVGGAGPRETAAIMAALVRLSRRASLGCLIPRSPSRAGVVGSERAARSGGATRSFTSERTCRPGLERRTGRRSPRQGSDR